MRSHSQIWKVRRVLRCSASRIHESVSDQRAAERLKALLGSSVEVIDVGNGEYFVQLWHGSFQEYITSVDSIPFKSAPNTLKFSIKTAQNTSCPYFDVNLHHLLFATFPKGLTLVSTFPRGLLLEILDVPLQDF